MNDLPAIGERVKVWPMPGRHVLTGAFQPGAGLLTQGQQMPTAGQEVVWDYYWFSQLREGALLLHPPPCEDHDHGSDGIDDCRHCGRTLGAAQVYDIHVGHGCAAAKTAHEARTAESEARAKAHKKSRDERIQAARKDAAAAAQAARAQLAPQTSTVPDPATK